MTASVMTTCTLCGRGFLCEPELAGNAVRRCGAHEHEYKRPHPGYVTDLPVVPSARDDKYIPPSLNRVPVMRSAACDCAGQEWRMCPLCREERTKRYRSRQETTVGRLRNQLAKTPAPGVSRPRLRDKAVRWALGWFVRPPV